MALEACTTQITCQNVFDEQRVFTGFSDILEETLKILLSLCNDEPTRLRELNDRFASNIDRLTFLKEENHNLQVQVEHLRVHETKRISSLYEEQMSKMREEMENLTRQKAETDLKLKELTIRLETETKLRREAEERIAVLLKECNTPALETHLFKIRSLEEKIALMNKIYEERNDTEYWRKIITDVKRDNGGPNTDWTVILTKIRQEMVKLIGNSDINESEVLYKSKITEWKKRLRVREEELNEAHQKISEFALQIQNNNCEISSLRATIEGLKGQILRTVEYHKIETDGLQKTISSLKEEISSKESEMAFYVRKYQGLHNAKAVMNLEITAYKHLLEAQEGRMKASKSSNPSQMIKGEYYLEAFRREHGGTIIKETRISQHEEPGQESAVSMTVTMGQEDTGTNRN
ncbi:glial fibrillary acidic protein [Fundulus heteroclitus]|uniref:glial fibrillary acidic protein n=1 Tax=Fundulus heteroclitus TaxID=8078 RepID=UPI00165C69C7|nr:glial fibrillary acidic protein [Fundulus heteroclitus]